jgi:hypothetical protein
VRRYPKADYLFRAVIPRETVALTVARSILGINYPNFKNSVADDDLQWVYSNVWLDMAQLQSRPPYSGESQTT